MQMIKTRKLLAIGVCALTAMGFSWSTQAADTVKIGVLVPLTGATAADGDRLLRAHKLAAKQINEQGGIKSLNGAQVELVVADTQSKPEVSRSEADRLISRSGVSVLMGAWASAATIPALQVAERYQTPFIVTSAVTDSITEKGLKYVFRVSPKGSWAADSVMDFMKYMGDKGASIKKVAIAFEDGPFGQGVAKGYKTRLQARGIDVVAEESFRTGSADLSTQAAKLKASGADLVLIVCYVDDETVLLRAMAAQEYRPFILGFGGHVHPTLLQLGDLVENTFGVVEWMQDVKKPAAEAFVKAYQAEYDGEIPLSHSAQAYASTWTAALALEKAGSADPVKVRDALAGLNLPDGPASLLPEEALAFDEHGQNHVRYVIAQVIGNQFVTVWPESVASKQVVIPK
ncbi:ABC transporter substrate-binding protein [Castellaniella sp. S9]|uniref:ABC transporter substrate-binding protein n=1 Tax=Castellaniella sp. S9 TaxID=2993652 RepID=UPI0022B5B6D7|nr:ABC transporter substrate-binding protein [Castellaniella sp. S9]